MYFSSGFTCNENVGLDEVPWPANIYPGAFHPEASYSLAIVLKGRKQLLCDIHLLPLFYVIENLRFHDVNTNVCQIRDGIGFRFLLEFEYPAVPYLGHAILRRVINWGETECYRILVPPVKINQTSHVLLEYRVRVSNYECLFYELLNLLQSTSCP
jgi:hypothetical protein